LSSNLSALDQPAPIRRRLVALATASFAALGVAGAAASQAQALTVSSDVNGLQMREPGFTRAAITLSLVDLGGVKYRVETPNFGGSAITVGPGCTDASSIGIAVAVCDRITPVVSEVSLGSSNDTFAVDPSFPDPITVNDTGDGPDSYQLGAGNDVARGGTRDSFAGGAGNDDLATSGGKLEGGDGNDRLHALNVNDFTGRVSEMTGDAGDDILTADGRAFVDMVGGDGTDSFDGGGAVGRINSRDGLPEQVSCGKRQPGVPRLRLVNTPRDFRTAVIDLVDVPSDADLIKGGCLTIDRAPNGEKTAAQLVSTSLKLRRGTVGVKVKCTTSKRCRGNVAVTVKGRTSAKRFSVRGRRTATIRLRARRGKATVRINEKGVAGDRSMRAALTVKR
jgi:hypothetical protein